MNKFILTMAAVCLTASSTFAQVINLTADKKVEWDSKNQKMTAIGNAVASKKGLKITADKMEAFYSKKNHSGKNKTDISKVHAEGKVTAFSDQTQAFGNKLDYDLITDSVILRGTPAKIKTAKEFITAENSIIYYPSKQKAVALGNVFAQDQKGNKIYSDKMIAFFTKNAQTNSLTMEKVEIYDNIKITTPDADVFARRGMYFPQSGIVKLFEQVTIVQDGNRLNGDFAETNFKTGVSKLVAGKSSQNRVSGIFKEKK